MKESNDRLTSQEAKEQMERIILSRDRGTQYQREQALLEFCTQNERIVQGIIDKRDYKDLSSMTLKILWDMLVQINCTLKK